MLNVFDCTSFLQACRWPTALQDCMRASPYPIDGVVLAFGAGAQAAKASTGILRTLIEATSFVAPGAYYVL